MTLDMEESWALLVRHWMNLLGLAEAGHEKDERRTREMSKRREKLFGLIFTVNF